MLDLSHHRRTNKLQSLASRISPNPSYCPSFSSSAASGFLVSFTVRQYFRTRGAPGRIWEIAGIFLFPVFSSRRKSRNGATFNSHPSHGFAFTYIPSVCGSTSSFFSLRIEWWIIETFLCFLISRHVCSLSYFLGRKDNRGARIYRKR